LQNPVTIFGFYIFKCVTTISLFKADFIGFASYSTFSILLTEYQGGARHYTYRYKLVFIV